jgi:transcriptional regulator with XRE-family HTH domain
MSEITKEVHQGRNIKRFREMLGIKQEAFALELGEEWSQQRVSLLEGKEEIEPEILEQVAKVLKVPAEAIRNFDEEKAINVISNTTFENCQQPAVINYNPTFNPIDKWIEALGENKKLYERLLQSEKEKVALLEKLLEQKK